MRLPRTFSSVAVAAAALALLGASALAEGPAKKPNGDAPDDLAPLGKAGDDATGDPVAHQNTPPIGGATQGGGGNPKEMGAVDAQRAQDKASAGDRIQPDNK